MKVVSRKSFRLSAYEYFSFAKPTWQPWEQKYLLLTSPSRCYWAFPGQSVTSHLFLLLRNSKVHHEIPPLLSPSWFSSLCHYSKYNENQLGENEKFTVLLSAICFSTAITAIKKSHHYTLTQNTKKTHLGANEEKYTLLISTIFFRLPSLPSQNPAILPSVESVQSRSSLYNQFISGVLYLNMLQSMTVKNAPPSYESFHLSVNFPLSHTVIAMLSCRSSVSSLWPRKSIHRSLLFFVAVCQCRRQVKHVTVLPLLKKI